MKLFSIALLLTAVAVAAEPQVQLKQVQSVYILPMARGMDQYLANKITRQGLFVIVTDPQRADAILADRIGEPFERKLEELYPAPTQARRIVSRAEEARAEEARADEPGKRNRRQGCG